MINKITYKRSTELRQEANGNWSVYDTMEWPTGKVHEIKRFEGSESDAKIKFNRKRSNSSRGESAVTVLG